MAITKLGFRRLHKLVEFMASLPKSSAKHFNMRDYITHSGNGHEHAIPKKPTAKDLHACGTAACALGWAVTVPSLRRAGLYLDVSVDWDGVGKLYSVEGSNEVFGLDEDADDHWETLFGSNNRDKSPKEWAKRVRKLLKQWEAESAR